MKDFVALFHQSNHNYCKNTEIGFVGQNFFFVGMLACITCKFRRLQGTPTAAFSHSTFCTRATPDPAAQTP
jgi:hypothetical protein